MMKKLANGYKVYAASLAFLSMVMVLSPYSFFYSQQTMDAREFAFCTFWLAITLGLAASTLSISTRLHKKKSRVKLLLVVHAIILMVYILDLLSVIQTNAPNAGWVFLGLTGLILNSIALVELWRTEDRSSDWLNYLSTAQASEEDLKLITNNGNSLSLMSETNPVLLVFLRHFGCTFCRKNLKTLAQDRSVIEALGTKVVLVHMTDENTAQRATEKYGLSDIDRISDPEKKLYQAFGLEQGLPFQLYGLDVLLRGIKLAIMDRLGLGKPKGDIHQMPGAFVVYQGEVVKGYRNHKASDLPDFIYLASCETCL